jgi:predicted Zn-dependent protease
MRLARVLPTVVVLALAAGCSINEQKEIAIGEQSHLQFEQQFGGPYADSQVQAYVNEVGLRVAQPAGRPNLHWQFTVLNSKEINAFAVPGGYIYITKGLLFRLQNEAMLAGVLGHESGHIALRHSVKQIEHGQMTQGVSTAVGIVGGLFGFGWAGDVTSVVGSLSLMKYGRDQEKEADLSGLKYMTAVGYNPQGMVQTMTVLQQAAKEGGSPPEFLSTHPNPGNRLQYLTDTIKKRYVAAADSGKIGEEEFRQNVLSRAAGVLPLPSFADATAWCAYCHEEHARGVTVASGK